MASIMVVQRRIRAWVALGAGLVACLAGSCTYEWDALDPRLGQGAVGGSGGTGATGGCAPNQTAPCYSADPATEDVGVCHGGTLTCNAEGTGWGPCEGEVTPVPEDCNTSYDDDCDGEVNEPDAECHCEPGILNACYGAAPATEGVGRCHEGEQICLPSGAAYGPCYGQLLPTHEDCATDVDDDCDTVANDHCATWSRRYGGTGYDHGWSLAVASDDGVVVGGVLANDFNFGGGLLDGDTEGDALLFKIDSNGSHVWSQVWGAADSYQSVNHVAIDPAGDIYVTGVFEDSIDFGFGALTSLGGRDGFVAKLDADGVPQWAVSFGGVDSQEPYGIAADSAGNAILTGWYETGIDFGGGDSLTAVDLEDGFVVKFDTLGNHVWSKSFGADGDDRGIEVAVDNADAIHVVGWFDEEIDFGAGPVGDAGSTDAFVVKLDPAGVQQWLVTLGPDANVYGEAITIDSAGNVWAGGDFTPQVELMGNTYDSLGEDDFWVLEIDAGGTALWGGTLGGTGDEDLDAMAADGQGNVMLGGSFDGRMDLGDGMMLPAGSDDWFMAKLDGGHAVQYSRRFGSPSGQDLWDIGADSGGNWYVVGDCYSGMDLGNGPLPEGSSDDICLGKFPP